MHDEEDDGDEHDELCDPARGEILPARNEHDGKVDAQDQERVYEKSREPHEKGSDRHPDVAKHIRSRDGDEENDRAEKKQGHAQRLAAQKRVFLFFVLFVSATDSVQNSLRIAPLWGAEIENDLLHKILHYIV